jgi:hypothetical protein
LFKFKRNSVANPIQGTLKLRAYLPIEKGKLILNKFFTSAVSRTVLTVMAQENMTLDDAKGFVTCIWTMLGG